MKEKAEKEAERARKKADRDSKKAIQQSQNGKRKTSISSSNRNKRQKRVADTAAVEEALGAALALPLK
ncbi:hypothetical protein PtrM4_070510 [Pyrenophora tritici-repentis]|uniref:Uncharacterized protein n=1 Tax=Pyrenophora tritici-repentis TaxID=45151 RepID=A0A834S4H6_9PLEO|nr:hypothetical protein PtrM4_070510 [Pyrenophora tritici-repentis]